MINKTGSAALTGPNSSGEYEYGACILTLANGTSCVQGQVVCIDVTAKVGRSPAETANSGFGDQVVLPSSANAGIAFGVYQGQTISNTSGATQTYEIMALQAGAGVVSAQAKTAGTTVKVGDTLILNGTDNAPISGTAALNVKIGMVTATGAVTAKAGVIIAVPGSGATVQLVNCYVYIA